MFICHANVTLSKDVTELGLSYADADQIQLAVMKLEAMHSNCWVYKYVLIKISLRVSPHTLPCGGPIAQLVTALLLYVNICSEELLGCAA